MFLHDCFEKKTSGDSGGDGCYCIVFGFSQFSNKNTKRWVSRDAVGFYHISHVNL